MQFIGNKKVISFVEKVLNEKTYAQAYLFSGPESVGKFFLAKAFSCGIIEEKNLFFPKEDGERLPLDLIIIAPEIEEKKGKKREKVISIEKIREAQKEMSLYPHSGKRRVLIVNNAHKMNVSSQNALLKILEEPNSTSIIILISHEDSKLIPTIKSRCQKIVFSLVGKNEMSELGKLVRQDLFNKFELISMGRPGIFLSFLKNSDILDSYEKDYDDLENFFNLDINQKLSYAEKISKDTTSAIKTLNVWIWIFRKKYFERGGDSPEEFYSKIDKIEKAILTIKNTNANARIVLESLLINI